MSSWDDVTIGDVPSRTSSICVPNIPGLYENDVSYWVSDGVLDLGGRIAKDTREGKTIGKLLKRGESPKIIRNYIDRCLLKHVNTFRLMKVIQQAELASFERGRKAMRQEIKDVLDLG